jgi:hypothetical protein
MNRPTGLVSARITAKKIRIWYSPTAVMSPSESLRPEQRVDQVDEQEHAGETGNEVIHTSFRGDRTL